MIGPTNAVDDQVSAVEQVRARMAAGRHRAGDERRQAGAAHHPRQAEVERREQRRRHDPDAGHRGGDREQRRRPTFRNASTTITGTTR